MFAANALPDTSLAYVHDLTEAQLLDLQKNSATPYSSHHFFQDKIKSGGYGPALAVIPAGRFSMGSTAQEFGHRREEYPQHTVTLAQAFAIGRYPVTAEEFERFRTATEWQLRPELIWSRGRYPVINVRLEDIKLYLAWLNEETGQRYRLPTEAEWEYAARAGSATPFSFGYTVSCKEVQFNPAYPYQEALEKKRWYWPRCLPSVQASEVGLRAANVWGLFDMHGNVWEFTSTHWSSSHLGANRDGSPSSNTDPHWYVTKGGSWFDPAVLARSAARKKRYWDELDVNLGFRVVREL